MMRIFLEEWKKLFTWKFAILLVLVSLVFYQLFIVFEFKYFPNGRPTLDTFMVTQEMLENYGEGMDEKEFLDFQQQFEDRKALLHNYLEEDEKAVESDLTTYEALYRSEVDNEVAQDLREKVGVEKEDLIYDIQARESIISSYEDRKEMGISYLETSSNPALLERIEQLRENGSAENIFSYIVFENYDFLIKDVAILSFFSIMLFIMPLYLKDRKNKVIHLQYATKKGRMLFRTKLAAAVTGGILVITAQLILFFSFYAANDTHMFLSQNINSFINFVMLSWFDLTFLQYIILTVAAIYILGIALIVVCAWISNISPNYMTSVGVHVPLAFVFFGVGTTYLVRHVTTLELPKYTFLIGLAVVLLMSSLVVFWSVKREKRKDILV
ncbi:hypothetical protein [Bacillus sp. CHD6a]|uniref:hypothetical protein n=1 Tax=Bacillus sp. CHD6a TaxID=1643452 RepID=UPI0012E11594|nr:hypothetical protein [Bacillus sp. CHD6a]